MAKLTVKNVSAALEKYSGNITAVAKSLGVHRSTVYRKIHKHESLQDELKTARETMLDNVESTLYRQALEGNTTAMIFFLKTQGKSRGYTERHEFTGMDGGPIEHKLDDEQTNRAISTLADAIGKTVSGEGGSE